MIKRLVASAVTDENGVASFDTAYASFGSGEVDFIARYNDVDEIVESDTFELGDCIAYDGGVTGDNNNDLWIPSTANLTTSVTDTGTVVTNSGGGNHVLRLTNPYDNSVKWNAPVCAEFDLLNTTDNGMIQFMGETELSRWWSSLGVNDGEEHHIKVTYDGTNFNIYVDNNSTPIHTDTGSITDFNIRFRVIDGKTLTFKNFKVYSLDDNTFRRLLYFDDAKTDSTSNYYLNTNYFRISYGTDEIILTGVGNSIGYCDLRSLANTIKGKKAKFRCDVEPNNCNVRLEVYSYGSPKSATGYTSSATTLETEATFIETNATTGFFRIYIKDANTNSTVKFKNFTVWEVD